MKPKINWNVTPEEILDSIREKSGGMRVYQDWLKETESRKPIKPKKEKVLKGGLE